MKVNAVLTGCCVHKNRDIPVFAVEPDGRGGETTFHVLIGSRWTGYDEEPEWLAAGMAGALYPGATDWVIVAASAEGELWELTPGTAAERRLKVPGDALELTRLVTLGGLIYACGMDRVVLRREANADWSDISAPPGDDDDTVVGFTDLASLADGTLIAVGWRGEIWLQWHAAWSAEDSGSNANFNAVSVGPDGSVVVVGDGGAVVVGRPSQWKVLDSGTEFNVQDVCHFNNNIFVCTDFEIFRLESARLVPEDRFASDDRPGTCMNLIPGKDTLYCQGEQDIFRFAEGVWSRVF